MLTAQETDVRVEDLSRRTEFTRVYANPDGSWTNETASGPESVQNDDGVWQEIDTTLVERDGVLQPQAVGTGLELSDGGERVFASLSSDGHDLGWRWDSPLPEPVVEGSTATYVDAVDGGDLVVTATPTGFSHSIVLRERPAEPVEFSIPITTGGGDLVENVDGGLKVTQPNGSGAVLTAPAPLMWDASETADGEVGTDPVVVDASVGETSNGTPELTLTPDADFLDDPDTVYPVTVDPTYTTTPFAASGDTWISGANPSGINQNTSQELRVGTQDLGATKSRSYLRFNDLLTGLGSTVTINSASLVLRNFASLSCNASAINASQVAENWTINTLVWSDQPLMSASNRVSYSPAKGFDSSCPAGDATWNVTGIVNDWFNGDTVNYGLRLTADDETVNKSWRKYRSSEVADTGLKPRINVTYSAWPTTVLAGVDDATWINGTAYVKTRTPSFFGGMQDTDLGQGSVRFELRAAASAGAELLGYCDTPPAPQYTTVRCTPALTAPGIPLNTAVYMRAKGKDDTGNWAGGSLTAAAGWTNWATIKRVPPVLQGSVGISPCTASCGTSVQEIGSRTPTFTASASDTDTGTLQYTFTVRDNTTQQVVTSGVVSKAQSQVASWTAPASVLVRDKLYQVQVTASDLGTPTAEGPWSTFKIANSPPTPPGAWSITPCTGCTDAVPFAASPTPTMSVTSTDPDGGSLQYAFAVRDTETLESIASGTASQTQGQGVSWTVPAGKLVPGSLYEAQVKVSDGEAAAVEGPWRSFGVRGEEDEADATEALPGVPIGTATEYEFEPSDDINELGQAPGANAAAPKVSLGSGQWVNSLSPVEVQRIGGPEAMSAGRSPGVNGGPATDTAGVGLNWAPVPLPAGEEGPPAEFELSFGAGPSGWSGAPGSSTQSRAVANQITETATQDGLAVRVNTAGFAESFGGNWSDRMVVTAYPACYDTTPEIEECSQGVVVPTIKDEATQKLSFTAPPVAAAGAPLTATAAGLATAGDLSTCYPAVGSTPAEIEAEDQSPFVADNVLQGPDGSVDFGLEDLEGVNDPTFPAPPSGGEIPDDTAGDEDLDLNDDGVEDVESGDGIKPTQKFVDDNLPVTPPVPVLAANAPAGCRGMVLRFGATAGSYADPPSSSTVKPSGTWQVGEGSGEFSWNYPFTMPSGIGGELPSLALSYSSGAVDGMTTRDNSQGSAAGLGWTMEPGYISRSYRSCAKDGHPAKGDLCWRTLADGTIVNEISLSLAGHNTTLVKVADHQWRLADDPGWRVESSGEDDAMSFEITSTDGTVYSFGGRPTAANSVWTVPVYGNDTGERCHGQPGQWCQQPWRWNLDKVTTSDGDEIEYTYTTETNAYKRWGTTLTNYDAAGQLSLIRYGFVRGGTAEGNASVQVNIVSGARCTEKLKSSAGDCDTIDTGDTLANGPREKPKLWPDVPTDLICTTSTPIKNCPNLSPSFFSRKRYETITTQTLGASDQVARNVDRYTLIHTMPDPDRVARGDEPNLWLSKISHEGLVGSVPVTDLTTTFKGTALANRVGGKNADRRYFKYRVAMAQNETGGRVIVSYGHSDGNACDVDFVKDRARFQQLRECFAQRYTPPGKEPIWEWYHKYVVTRLWVGDNALGLRGGAQFTQVGAHSPGSVRVIDYVYNGHPAWRFDTSENIPLVDRTWNDWRGYVATEIRTRSINDSNQVIDGSESIRKVVRFRGMANTRLDNSPDGGKNPNITINTVEHPDGIMDRPRLAGRIAEETVYEGGQKATWYTRTYHGYDAIRTAADNNGHYAHITMENLTRTYTRMWNEDGTTRNEKPRENVVARAFAVPENPLNILSGALLSETTSGTLNPQAPDDAKAGPVCTYTEWASDQGRWIRAPYRVTVKDTDRGAAADLKCARAISRTTSYYDGHTATDDPKAIGKGRVTTVVADNGPLRFPLPSQSSSSTTTTTSTYDDYGRVTRTTNARGLATTYVYNDAWGNAPAGSPANSWSRAYSVTATQVIPGDDPVIRTQLDAARGLPTKSEDENGNIALTTYDGLGRLASYMSPRHEALNTAANTSPNKAVPTVSYDYDVNSGQPSRITTKTRRGDKAVDKTYAFIDGWGRTIETQRPGPNGDRLVATTRYDEQGLPAITIPELYANGEAGNGLLNADPAAARRYTRTVFDPLGRPTALRRYRDGVLYSTAKTDYLGDKTIATPARGGRTFTYLDLNQNPWKIEQYSGGSVAHSAKYLYGAGGQLRSIKSAIGGTERTWSYQYDLAGRRTQASDPDTGVTTYEYYDDLPDISTGGQAYTLVTSPSGAIGSSTTVTLRTDYDTRGRPTQLRKVTGTTLGSPLSTWSYDNTTVGANGRGRLLTETATNSALGSFTRTVDKYDQNGNPTHVTYSAGPSGTYKAAETYQYTDDRITNVTYDEVKSPTSGAKILPETTLKYTYKTAGALQQITATDGSAEPWNLAVVQYRNTGRTLSIESAASSQTGQASANNYRLVRTYGWDETLGQLASIRGNQYGALRYSYDEVGNPTLIAAVDNNEASLASWCYTYDPLNRLQSAKTGRNSDCTGTADANYRGGTQEQNLAYTYVDDRITTVKSGPTSAQKTSTYNYSPNRPHQTQSITAQADPYLPKTTNLTYDAAGRVTQQTSNPDTETVGTANYTYNDTGTLGFTTYPCESPTGTQARLDYAYDSGGLRTGRKLTNCGTDSTLVTLGNTEITTTGATATARRQYATPGGTPLAIQDGSATGSTTWTWLLGDQQDTIRFTKKQTNGTTTKPTYLPFGDPATTQTAPSLEGERGYLNKTQDPNGEIRLDHRTYNASLNILTTPDPLLSPTNPQTLNPYAYSRNNPIAWSDPSGLADSCVKEGTCPSTPDPTGGPPAPETIVTPEAQPQDEQAIVQHAMAKETLYQAGAGTQSMIVNGVATNSGAVLGAFYDSHPELWDHLLETFLKATVFDPGACGKKASVSCGIEIVGIIPFAKVAKAPGLFEAARDLDRVRDSANGADNVANGMRLRAQLAGQEISGGHAFQKHVIDKAEFPGITTRSQFAQHIENVVSNGAMRPLERGRTGYWRDGTVVIRDPNHVDGGTAFRPTGGYDYFLGLD